MASHLTWKNMDMNDTTTPLNTNYIYWMYSGGWTTAIMTTSTVLYFLRSTAGKNYYLPWSMPTLILFSRIKIKEEKKTVSLRQTVRIPHYSFSRNIMKLLKWWMCNLSHRLWVSKKSGVPIVCSPVFHLSYESYYKNWKLL